jgi:hypothetical protein
MQNPTLILDFNAFLRLLPSVKQHNQLGSNMKLIIVRFQPKHSMKVSFNCQFNGISSASFDFFYFISKCSVSRKTFEFLSNKVACSVDFKLSFFV